MRLQLSSMSAPNNTRAHTLVINVTFRLARRFSYHVCAFECAPALVESAKHLFQLPEADRPSLCAANAYYESHMRELV